jgi:hypothetical protein
MSLIILVVAAIAIYLVRQALPLVGFIWLVCVAVAPLIAIGLGIEFLLRRFTRFDIHEIPEFGLWLQRFHQVREVAPYAPRPALASKSTVNELDTLRVDMLGDVIEKGLISSNSDRFLFGMFADNTPMYGVWDRVKSLIIAGVSGSGKSVTMVFVIIQIMLSKHARLFVVDPHHNKPDGLTSRLKPLQEYATFVHSDADTMRVVDQVRNELENRIAGSPCHDALLLVIDEWNRIASRNKEVFDSLKWVIEEIGQEGRGYGVYVLLGGQIWQPSKSGGSSIIDSIQSVYCHRLKRNQSRFILDSETAKLTEKLAPGHVYFSDANGDVERIIIPESKYRDAVTVRDMLRDSYPLLETNQPYNQQQLTPGSTSTPGYYDETECFTDTPFEPETERFTPKNTLLPSPVTMKRFVSREDKLSEIVRLRSLNFNQSQIIQAIWSVKPGATAAYQTALNDYKQLLDMIVRSR